MPEGTNKFFQPFLALSPAKRVVVVVVALTAVLAFAALISIANQTDYRPLFANLTTEDAGEIVQKLKEQKVPYRISDDGKSIMVPVDQVYDLRLSLASEGLPQGGGVGFEIFDQKNFGMTEFVQKLNYQRALQGELSRTISQIAGVESARVSLAIAAKTLFKESERPSTASVLLKMKANRSLRESEVQGITHLVASSIEGMDPENVTVLDQRGKLLNSNSMSDPVSKITGGHQERQRLFEKTTEEKLQTLLDKVVGTGKSAARVSATFDLKQVERYEERYDPESAAVRSEQRSEEQGASSTASGAPGVQSNLGRTPAGAGVISGGTKTDETLNYEVSRSTARTVEAVGGLSKISVAILVDGKYVVPPGAQPGAKPRFQPLTPDELQKIEALVKSAVGFNAERGDQVTVANIPFQDMSDETIAEPEQWWEKPVMQSLIKNGVIAIGFLLVILFVFRPLLKVLKTEKSASDVSMPPFDMSTVLDTQKKHNERERLDQIELAEKVKQDPHQVVQILQNWLGEG